MAPPVAQALAAELRDVLQAAEAGGYQVVFIDTPPHTAPAIDLIARSVNLAIIPVQPSVLDVAATQNTVALLRAAGVPMVAVLTRAPPTRDEETIETEKALGHLGVTLLATRICERKAYRRALTQGQAVAEFDPSSKAAQEIAALWKEIEAVHPAQKKTKRKLGAAA